MHYVLNKISCPGNEGWICTESKQGRVKEEEEETV